MSSIRNSEIYKQDQQIILHQATDSLGVYEWSSENDNLSDTFVAFDKATQFKKDIFNGASSKEAGIQLQHDLYKENDQTSRPIYGFYQYFTFTTRSNTAQFDPKNQGTTSFNLTVSNHFSFIHVDDDQKTQHNLCIFHDDLHLKGTDNEPFYGILSSDIERKYKIKPHELPQSSRTKSYFQTTTTLKPMTEELIHGINWCTIPHNLGFNHDESEGIKLKICQKRWIESCTKSMQNQDLPILPIIVKDGMNHWMEWIKIIYVESHNVVSGVQFGYDRDDLLLFAAWLRVECGCGLPTDLKDLIMGFYGALRVKSICMDPQYVYCMHRAVSVKEITAHEMKEIYDKKWVRSIDICDISSKLEQMAVKYGFELNVAKQCFNDHDIDYLYLQNHTRADFVGLLRSYGIKIGTAIKMYGVLREDVVDGGEEEYSQQ